MESQLKRDAVLFLALALFIAVRLVGLALGWLLWERGLVPTRPLSPDQIYLSVEPPAGPVSGWVLGVWHRLDTSYYLEIASNGYSAAGGIVVFPPLYPLLIRLGRTVLTGRYLSAALLISSAVCVALLALLYEEAAAESGAGSARRTVVYQIVFPTAYAKPLMLLFILLAFCWAREGRWGLAGATAFLATLTRLQAVVLILPLATIYLRQFGLSRRALHPEAMAVLAAPAAVLVFSLCLAWQGLPSVPESYAQAWASIVAVPGTDLVLALLSLFKGAITFSRALSLGLTVLFLGLTAVALRRLSLEYGLYKAGMLPVSLSRHDQADRELLAVSSHVLGPFPRLHAARGRRSPPSLAKPADTLLICRALSVQDGHLPYVGIR